MPGEQRDSSRHLPSYWSPPYERQLHDIVVAFRDRSQTGWRSGPDGRLEELEPGAETPP
jgi:hypothetical protein